MLEIIVTGIALATVLNIILKNFHIPTIIGYIITGICLSYFFNLGGHGNNHELQTIAEFGIVFLMFTIGLEFSIKQLLKMKKNVLLYGGLQFFITSFIFYGFSYYIFHFPLQTSIIIGAGLALSSTAIVLKILNENGDISKEYGHKALGILLFQDLAVIPILLLITVFSSTGGSIGALLGTTILSAFGLIVGLFLVGKYLLNPFLESVSKTNSNEIFVGAILLLVMGASYLAHYLGLSYSLGALIAGILISETHYKHQVEADLIPFRNLLLGVFFVTVGMQLNFPIIINNLGIILPFLVFLVFIKIFIIYWILRIGTKRVTSLRTALSLFQIGEFGIVIFELASVNGIVNTEVSQLIITIIILSMIITPFVLRHISNITDFLINENLPYKEEKIAEKNLQNHIILIGYGRLGKVLAQYLEENKYKYIIIERSAKAFKQGKKDGQPIYYGDSSQKEILKSLGAEKATALMVSVGNNKKLYLICEAISKVATKGKIIVKVNKYEEKEMLEELHLNKVIVETEATADSMFHEIEEI